MKATESEESWNVSFLEVCILVHLVGIAVSGRYSRPQLMAMGASNLRHTPERYYILKIREDQLVDHIVDHTRCKRQRNGPKVANLLQGCELAPGGPLLLGG